MIPREELIFFLSEWVTNHLNISWIVHHFTTDFQFLLYNTVICYNHMDLFLAISFRLYLSLPVSIICNLNYFCFIVNFNVWYEKLPLVILLSPNFEFLMSSFLKINFGMNLPKQHSLPPSCDCDWNCITSMHLFGSTVHLCNIKLSHLGN